MAAALVLPAVADDGGGLATRLRVGAGYETYLHTYHLATDDTTETVAEFNVSLEYEARSARRTAHQWHARAEVAAGSQLVRELIDLGYRWRPDNAAPRLRADLQWTGRQYHEGSDFALSSDLQDLLGELRLYPYRDRRVTADVRLRGRRLDYRRPSILEQDQRDLGVGAFLSAADGATSAWRVGARRTDRSYPDSASIDRRMVAVEGDLDHSGERGDLWLYHRSERRRVADPDVRPSAWLHWSEARLAVPAGGGSLVANLGSEVWQYERETTVWFDSWRGDVELGYRWGDLLSSQQHALVTVQNLAAGDSPEAYTQVGVRGSVEAYGRAISGMASLELGRRWYRQGAATTDADPFGDLVLSYSDFTYLELWLMATWHLGRHLSLELTASYQPERHTETDDNTVLGYGSLRLSWRP